MAPYLDSKGTIDASRFIKGTFLWFHANEQHRLSQHPGGPLAITSLKIGPPSEIQFGSLVTLRGNPDNWSVRAIDIINGTIDVIRDDRKRPTQATVARSDVTAHVSRSLPIVSAASKAISPRCIGDVFANTIIEHPDFPNRAYVVSAHESARMMGVRLPNNTPEHVAQVFVGDAIERATAEAIAKRNITYIASLTYEPAARQPAASNACAPAIASTPLPPPLRRPSDNGHVTLLRGLETSMQLIHEIFAHTSPSNTLAAARHYKLRQGREPLPRCVCNASANMVRTRTNKTSRSTEVRTHGTTIHMDLFGPVDVEGRGGVRYGFVAAVETHYVNNGTLTRGPDYPWVRALRSKDEAIIAITELHNELMAQGITLRIAFSDSGGEFSGNNTDTQLRNLGIVHRPRVSEAHDDRAEGMVKRVKQGVRAVMLRAGAPASLWPDAMLCVAAGLQTLVNDSHGISAHRALLRQEPDLSSLAPFYSIVYAYDTQRANSSFKPRGLPVRYLSPAPEFGIGAIRVSVRGSLRIVRTAEYAGPLETKYDATTLSLPQTPVIVAQPAADDVADLSDDDMNADGTPKLPASDAPDDPDNDNSDIDNAAVNTHTRYPRRTRNPPQVNPRGTIHPGGGLGNWRTGAAALDIGLTTPLRPPIAAPDDNSMTRLGPCRTAPEGFEYTAVGTDGAAYIHADDGTTSKRPPGTMSIPEALRAPTRDKFVEAISKEDMLIPDNFPDKIPAMVRVPKSEVPRGAPICNTLSINLTKRDGRHKSRMVLDESRAYPGRRPEDSSPTCLTSTLFLVLSIACHFGWCIAQFDVTGAYLLAAPVRLQYARFPRGWRAYLIARHGRLPYDPDNFLMRVN